MGVKEFHEWSDRIIGGALIPGATAKSLKFALAHMVMHMKPTESHSPDAYFIHSLRKAASNQVCWAMIQELQGDVKKEEEDKKLKVVSPMEVNQNK